MPRTSSSASATVAAVHAASTILVCCARRGCAFHLAMPPNAATDFGSESGRAGSGAGLPASSVKPMSAIGRVACFFTATLTASWTVARTSCSVRSALVYPLRSQGDCVQRQGGANERMIARNASLDQSCGVSVGHRS
eukprot:scaffold87036_cov75-Phaeocystis_antarctica.AAC.5